MKPEWEFTNKSLSIRGLILYFLVQFKAVASEDFARLFVICKLDIFKIKLLITFEISVKLYLSPVETYCTNINYYIPDENNETKDFSDDAWTRLRK